MFCNHCGTKNPEGALYCSNDGAALLQVSEKVRLHREEMKFCRHCSHENTLAGSYCPACGHTLEKVIENQEEKGKTESASPAQMAESFLSKQGFIGRILDRKKLIHTAAFAGISVVVLFIISAIISALINQFIRKELLADLGPLADGIKLISMSDVYMLTHMASVDFKLGTGFFEGALQTTSGLFLLLIIPAIIFIIVGFFMQRKYKESSMAERLVHCLSFSVIYGVIAGVISLFAGGSTTIADPSGYIGAMTASADYPFFESVFNAFIISLIFTAVGSVIGLAKEQRRANLQYGLSISRAIINTVIGLAVSMVIGFFLIQSNEEIKIGEEKVDAVIASQLGGYIWNVAQFGSLNLDIDAYGEEVQASYSLLGGAKASEDEESFKEDLSGIKLILWVFVLIPLALHFWAGHMLRKSSQGNLLYELGAYAIAFGLVNALFVTISKLSVTTNLDGVFSLSFGYSAIVTFFITAIFAFAVSYGAVMLTNRQSSHKEGQTYAA